MFFVMEHEKKDAASREREKKIICHTFFSFSHSPQFSERKRPKVKVISRSRRARQRLSPGAQHDDSQHGEKTVREQQRPVQPAGPVLACTVRVAGPIRTAAGPAQRGRTAGTW